MAVQTGVGLGFAVRICSKCLSVCRWPICEKRRPKLSCHPQTPKAASSVLRDIPYPVILKPSNKDFAETAQICSLVWVFTARIYDKGHVLTFTGVK